MGIQGTDYLIGCSKLQDLLEVIIENINQHDTAVEAFQVRLDVLDPDGAKGAGGKSMSFQDRLDQLEQLGLEQGKKVADLFVKVGVEHSALEAEHSHLAKLEEMLKSQQQKITEQAAEQEAHFAALEEELHGVENELHEVEKHEKEIEALQEKEMQAMQAKLEGGDGDNQKSVMTMLEELTKDVEDLKIKAGGKGGGGAGGALSDEIMQAIAAVMAPLSAAIDALDAKYEAHVVCRLESHDSRITEQEKLSGTLIEQAASADREAERLAMSASAGKASFCDGPEQREAALKEIADAQNSAASALSAVKQEMLDAQNSMAAEMGQLSGKVTEVVDSVSTLEDEVRQGLQRGAQSGEGGSDDRAHDEQIEATLGRVREQLEGRVAALEEKIEAKDDPIKSDDITELSEALQQVESDLRSLDAVATQDMRPKLEKQASEMQRLWQQLNDVWQRMQNVPAGAPAAAGSMLTKTQGPRCLVCYDPGEKPMQRSRTIIGKDGKSYFQGLDRPDTSPAPLSRRPGTSPCGGGLMEQRSYAPPSDNAGMISALLKPRMGQSSPAHPSRKYMQTAHDDNHLPNVRSHSRSTSSLRAGSPGGVPGAVSGGADYRVGRGMTRQGGPRMGRHGATPSVAGFYF